MARIVVLGGGGGVGGVAARALATAKEVTQLIVADARLDAAQATVALLPEGALATACAMDAASPESLAAVLADADVVLNCVGPFYRFGPPVLRAAIEAGVNYVDVCDDLAPTRAMLELHGEAERRGVTCLLGMGNSPGLANVLVKLCADQLLEHVDEVDIFHIHGGEPVEGPAVIKHRIAAMIDPVPLFLDGRMVEVQQLAADGEAQVEEVDFPNVGTSPVYPYPHPETITLPQHIPGLKHATNKGAIFPLPYFHLTQDMVRVGACGTAPLEVNGVEVSPIDFSVAHILSRRAALLKEAGVKGPAGCLKIVVAGRQGGERQRFTFTLSSRSSGAGEGTGIPAAAGAVMMALGEVHGPGVLPPEAAVAPLPMLMRAMSMAKALGTGAGTAIAITREDADGSIHEIPLPF